MEDLLNKLGIPSYISQIVVDLPSANNTTVQLNDKVPESAGWIYGMSVEHDGTTPTDQTKVLINAADMQNLWLQLKYGTSIYIDNYRLDKLSWRDATVPIAFRNYTPFSIPADTAWKNSVLLNPTGIINKTVIINVYFIDKGSYQHLVDTGVFWKNGRKTNPDTKG